MRSVTVAAAAPSGAAAVARLPHRDCGALLEKLKALADAPFGFHPSALPMRGQPGAVGVRQGDWRAVCRIDREGDRMTVEFIAHRREVYR